MTTMGSYFLLLLPFWLWGNLVAADSYHGFTAMSLWHRHAESENNIVEPTAYNWISGQKVLEPGLTETGFQKCVMRLPDVAHYVRLATGNSEEELPQPKYTMVFVSPLIRAIYSSYAHEPFLPRVDAQGNPVDVGGKPVVTVLPRMREKRKFFFNPVTKEYLDKGNTPYSTAEILRDNVKTKDNGKMKDLVVDTETLELQKPKNWAEVSVRHEWKDFRDITKQIGQALAAHDFKKLQEIKARNPGFKDVVFAFYTHSHIMQKWFGFPQKPANAGISALPLRVNWREDAHGKPVPDSLTVSVQIDAQGIPSKVAGPDILDPDYDLPNAPSTPVHFQRKEDNVSKVVRVLGRNTHDKYINRMRKFFGDDKLHMSEDTKWKTWLETNMVHGMTHEQAMQFYFDKWIRKQTELARDHITTLQKQYLRSLPPPVFKDATWRLGLLGL